MLLLPVWLPDPMFLPVGVSVSGPMFLPGGLCLNLPDRNSPWTETPRQRPPGQRPQTESPLDRDPPGQRPTWTESPLYTDPLYGKERAVCILLECSLVFFVFILKAGNITEKSTMVYRTYHGELMNVSDFATAKKVIILYQYRH